MDAPNPSALPTFASRTPLHVGAVGLKVRDLDRLCSSIATCSALRARPWQDVATLGAGGVPVIHLEHQPGAKPDDTRTAGLYHTAFLMPTRADLARWILHVARHKVPLTGASDHGVSEAFYLDDPEGNGIEVYSDRPAESWQWTGNELKMITDPLDLDDILREVPPAATYPALPTGCASATFICASETLRAPRRSIATRSGLTLPAAATARASCRRGATTTTSPATSGTAPARDRATRTGPDCHGSRSKPPMTPPSRRSGRVWRRPVCGPP